jgi:quercetin dioxygenase-like cupin family protein
LNSLAFLAALSSVALLASPSKSQQSTPIDPVAASPRQFTVLLDNEHVRVVEYTLRPGERDQWHTHPPKVSYVVSGGELRIHMSDGTSFPASEKAGSASWMGVLPRHFAENVGTTTVRIALTEIKSSAAPSAAARAASSGARPRVFDTTAVMAPVRDFVESFNKGDATTSRTGCRFVTSIVDDFPPHEWHGAGACARWMQSYRVYTKANGLADMIIALGSPSHVDVTAERAYVVVPANYTIEVHGTLVNKTNSIVTFALERSANEWHIIGWAWADG